MIAIHDPLNKFEQVPMQEMLTPNFNEGLRGGFRPNIAKYRLNLTCQARVGRKFLWKSVIIMIWISIFMFAQWILVPKIVLSMAL